LLIEDEIIEGVFLEEKKNRFLCNVLIGEDVQECYIPSASKLENYLKLKGKKILLKKNNNDKSRTKYSVFAVQYYGKYIILNLMYVNKILEEHIKLNYEYEAMSKEKYIDSYKADFLVLNNEKTVIEAKGIIATTKTVLFPKVYSSRAIYQLEAILELLKKGWKAEYYLISLSPFVKQIKLNNNLVHLEYWRLLKECTDNGMLLKGFNVCYENNEIRIKDGINIFI
jgi:DNA-binding sugar fermentation-stimulating protein